MSDWLSYDAEDVDAFYRWNFPDNNFGGKPDKELFSEGFDAGFNHALELLKEQDD